jgi:hypothetical protein
VIPWDCRVYELRQYTLRPGTRDAFVQLFETHQLLCGGGRPLPALQSLHAPNTFPQLPVHEDKHVAVTLTRHAGLAVAARRGAEPACRASTEELDALATGPVHRLRLRPTARSALR